MKKVILLLMFFMFSLALQASIEVKNVIKFQPSGTLIQGDSVKINVQLWPVESYDELKFLDLKGKVFLENFYVNEIKASRSENNYDVIILELDTIAESPAPAGKVVTLNFGEFTTSTSLPFEIEKMEDFDGQFVVLSQAVDYVGSKLNIILICATLILVILLVVSLRKKIEKYFNRNKKEMQVKAHYQTLFHNAKERTDFEEIYFKRNEWLVFIPEKTQALQIFFKAIEEHQYKKSWNKEELFEVKDSFDKIRGGLK